MAPILCDDEYEINEIINRYYVLSECDDIWKKMVKTELVTPNIIEANIDKLSFSDISLNPTIYDKKYEYSFLEKYKDKINWFYASHRLFTYYTPFSEDLVDKFYKYLDWRHITVCMGYQDTISLEFIDKYHSYFQWSELLSHKSITMEVLLKYVPYVFKQSESYCRLLYQNPNFNLDFVRNHLEFEWKFIGEHLKDHNDFDETLADAFLAKKTYLRDIYFILIHRTISIEFVNKWINRVEELEANYNIHLIPCGLCVSNSKGKLPSYKGNALNWECTFQNPNVWNYLTKDDYEKHFEKVATLAPRDYIEKTLREWGIPNRPLVNEKHSTENAYELYAKNTNLKHDFFDSENINDNVLAILLKRDDVPLWFIEKYNTQIDACDLWDTITAEKLLDETDYFEKYYERVKRHKRKKYFQLLLDQYLIKEDLYKKIEDVFETYECTFRDKKRRFGTAKKGHCCDKKIVKVNWYNIVKHDLEKLKE